ncbi:hypothetical protein [Pseudomonas sp. Gutcm_11s]|uniref:hypothetical protein n=1 Tax=Pseudomonas sp. Gutcm_11s TaxID=3026088 RepID=UPI002362B6AA|nr:hypothetical protein [Pseudomonas sp. Gutcm_11s]MDD0841248.1 hypothetical protein [Pseudomonas sp. Gutcm_11s]
MTQSEQIESELNRLIGLEAWGAAFAGGMLMIQFGTPRERVSLNGSKHNIGEYALHIQTTWRIDLNHGDPSQGITSSEHGDINFLLTQPYIESIKAKGLGPFTLNFSGGHCIEVSTPNVYPIDTEFWRLLGPGLNGRHFVVTSSGIE